MAGPAHGLTGDDGEVQPDELGPAFWLLQQDTFGSLPSNPRSCSMDEAVYILLVVLPCLSKCKLAWWYGLCEIAEHPECCMDFFCCKLAGPFADIRQYTSGWPQKSQQLCLIMDQLPASAGQTSKALLNPPFSLL